MKKQQAEWDFRERKMVRALFAMTCAFLISLGGLLGIATYTFHRRSAERETAAALLAADILGLEHEETRTVALALVQSRLPSLFSESERGSITAFLREEDSEHAIAQLCTSIRTAVAENQLHAEWLRDTMLALSSDTAHSSAGEAALTKETVADRPAVLRRVRASKRAAGFWGIPGLFRDVEVSDTAQSGAYCRNAYAAFSEPNGKITLFFSAFRDTDASCDPDVCVTVAKAYLRERHDIRTADLLESQSLWGVTWLTFDTKGTPLTLGVDERSLSVCFFART